MEIMILEKNCAISLCVYGILISNWVSTRTKQGGDFGWNNQFVIGNLTGISPKIEVEVAIFSKFLIV